LGVGGHTHVLLEKDSKAQCFGIDRDSEALQKAWNRLKKFKGRITLMQGNFKDLPDLLKSKSLPPRGDGILLDLGVSSLQLDSPHRGFSFKHLGPLDMRMDPHHGPTALELIQRLSLEELTDQIKTYGQERFSKPIALALKRAAQENRLTNTLECAQEITRLIRRYSSGPNRWKKERIHPATRTFQALRIGVNRELESLEIFLEQLPNLLNLGGRAVFISFHSLEDRLVKNAIRVWKKGCICPPRFPQCVCGKKPLFRELTRKPVTASDEEIKQNIRSRSAKLRAIERL
jgi:16S rRNA (cytosine1402-N4)-methyltransferase